MSLKEILDNYERVVSKNRTRSIERYNRLISTSCDVYALCEKRGDHWKIVRELQLSHDNDTLQALWDEFKDQK